MIFYTCINSILKHPVPVTTLSGLMYAVYLISEASLGCTKPWCATPNYVKTPPVINYPFRWLYCGLTVVISCDNILDSQDSRRIEKSCRKVVFYGIFYIFLKFYCKKSHKFLWDFFKLQFSKIL